MPDWIMIPGILVEGHHVAARPSKVYPYSTIGKQKPFFKQRGLDLDQYFTGSLNISISPYRFKMVKPEYTFNNVSWTDLHPPEHFSFSSCKVRFQEQERDGMVYYPHPETKIRHYQNPTVIEILAEFIPGISYGDQVELLLNTKEILLTK